MGTNTCSDRKKKKFSLFRALLIALILLAAVCVLRWVIRPAGETAETVPEAAPAASASPVVTASPAATAVPEPTATPGITIIDATAAPTEAPPSPDGSAEGTAPDSAAAGSAVALSELEKLDTVPGGKGQYTYAGADGDWVLDLRDNNLFTITDPDEKLHTGEGWSPNDDGTVTCGPTDIYGADFAFSGGCSRWAFQRGGLCFPVTNG